MYMSIAFGATSGVCLVSFWYVYNEDIVYVHVYVHTIVSDVVCCMSQIISGSVIIPKDWNVSLHCELYTVAKMSMSMYVHMYD